MPVIIMQGVPGSGKSTYIKELHPEAIVVSADSYFTDSDGNYKWDKTRAGEAHTKCLRDFVKYCSNAPVGAYTIVVDNTNSRIEEYAPYAALALAYGHSLAIVTILCDPFVAYRRNIHSVDLRTILAMDHRIRDVERVPSWWKHTVIRAG